MQKAEPQTGDNRQGRQARQERSCHCERSAAIFPPSICNPKSQIALEPLDPRTLESLDSFLLSFDTRHSELSWPPRARRGSNHRWTRMDTDEGGSPNSAIAIRNSPLSWPPSGRNCHPDRSGGVSQVVSIAHDGLGSMPPRHGSEATAAIFLISFTIRNSAFGIP